MGYLLPALASRASAWASSVLTVRRDSRHRLGDDHTPRADRLCEALRVCG